MSYVSLDLPGHCSFLSFCGNGTWGSEPDQVPEAHAICIEGAKSCRVAFLPSVCTCGFVGCGARKTHLVDRCLRDLLLPPARGRLSAGRPHSEAPLQDSEEGSPLGHGAKDAFGRSLRLA